MKEELERKVEDLTWKGRTYSVEGENVRKLVTAAYILDRKDRKYKRTVDQFVIGCMNTYEGDAISCLIQFIAEKVCEGGKEE